LELAKRTDRLKEVSETPRARQLREGVVKPIAL